MKIELVEVYGFRSALRGMRNAGESWAKADSKFHPESIVQFPGVLAFEHPDLGIEDLKLACKLIKSGYLDESMAEANYGEHKFLRDIEIWVDLTLAICLWSEFDTYKVDTVRNSCSTMYKLGTRDLTTADFQDGRVKPEYLGHLNEMGAKYRATQGAEHVEVLHDLKMDLPAGYLQKATYHFNYETALKIYFERRNHRMREWSGKGGICEWIKSLPYMPEFIAAAAR
jgi:hypothetical protein